MRLFLLLLTINLWATCSYAEPEEESVFDVTDAETVDVEDSVFGKIDGATDTKVVTESDVSGYYNSAKLYAINKITAKSRQITVQIGKSAYFDNAEIILHRCWKAPGRPMPINQALVTVTENKFDEDPKQIFQGWLISSQPALSTLEHPVYEVMAAECIGDKQDIKKR